jgi:hypothetical protein
MKIFMLRHRHLFKSIGFILIGIAAGAIYYSEFTCQDGRCPITGSQTNSIIWGLSLGLIAAIPGLDAWWRQIR